MNNKGKGATSTTNSGTGSNSVRTKRTSSIGLSATTTKTTTANSADKIEDLSTRLLSCMDRLNVLDTRVSSNIEPRLSSSEELFDRLQNQLKSMHHQQESQPHADKLDEPIFDKQELIHEMRSMIESEVNTLRKHIETNWEERVDQEIEDLMMMEEARKKNDETLQNLKRDLAQLLASSTNQAAHAVDANTSGGASSGKRAWIHHMIYLMFTSVLFVGVFMVLFNFPAHKGPFHPPS